MDFLIVNLEQNVYCFDKKMYVESFLFDRLKVKSVFVLISFCSIWTAGIQTYFLLSYCSGQRDFDIKQKKGFISNIQD